MKLSEYLIAGTFSLLTNLICRIDADQLKQAPRQGPLIFYTNHVNILEIPIFYTHSFPLRVRGMMLAERWQIPVLKWVLDQTGTIPLHRGEPDISAIRKGLAVLKGGGMIAISPEGTRSHDGILQPAHPGVVLLALHSGAPLIPVAYYGAEDYKKNLRRLKRTDFHLRMGKPFRLDPHGEPVTRRVREQMMDELMFKLAELLPPEYRGQYAEHRLSKPRYIVG